MPTQAFGLQRESSSDQRLSPDYFHMHRWLAMQQRALSIQKNWHGRSNLSFKSLVAAG